jgi:hypothetical protein
VLVVIDLVPPFFALEKNKKQIHFSFFFPAFGIRLPSIDSIMSASISIQLVGLINGHF